MDRNILVPLRNSFSIQFVIRSGVFARRLRSFIDWSIGYLWTVSLKRLCQYVYSTFLSTGW